MGVKITVYKVNQVLIYLLETTHKTQLNNQMVSQDLSNMLSVFSIFVFCVRHPFNSSHFNFILIFVSKSPLNSFASEHGRLSAKSPIFLPTQIKGIAIKNKSKVKIDKTQSIISLIIFIHIPHDTLTVQGLQIALAWLSTVVP